jgi:acyl carrier protein
MYDLSHVKAEHQLKDDLDLDSLDIVELVMKIETEYNIHIPDESFFDFNHLTVQQLTDVADSIIDGLPLPTPVVEDNPIIPEGVSYESHKIIVSIAFGVIMFLIALFDVELRDASSINEMSVWGKVAAGLFLSPFVYWFYEFVKWVAKRW